MHEAAQNNVKRTSFPLAWLAAQESNLFTARGDVDWKGLRDTYPDLFEQSPKAPASASAGSGTHAPPERKPTFDDIIRGAVR